MIRIRRQHAACVRRSKQSMHVNEEWLRCLSLRSIRWVSIRVWYTWRFKSVKVAKNPWSSLPAARKRNIYFLIDKRVFQEPWIFNARNERDKSQITVVFILHRSQSLNYNPGLGFCSSAPHYTYNVKKPTIDTFTLNILVFIPKNCFPFHSLAFIPENYSYTLQVCFREWEKLEKIHP